MILDILVLISFYIYLFRALKKYTREKALKFHEFFVIERIILASAFIFGIADVYIAGRTYTYNELIDESMFWNITLNTRCTLKDSKIVTRHCELSFMDPEQAMQYKDGIYELN